MFSPFISDGTIVYVRELIQEHYEDFVITFPDEHLIPNHHFLLEIPSLISNYGPPVRFSCMRFEAFHKVFKSFTAFCNFICIEKSLTSRYMKHIAKQSFLQSARGDGPGKVISAQKVEQLKTDFPEHNLSSPACFLNWVVLNENDKILFLVNIIQACRFSEQFFGYEVFESSLNKIYTHSMLLDYNIYQLVSRSSGEKF